MGMMSKNSRLPERPRPPALNDIELDLKKAVDTDIALSIGEKYLQNINLASNVPSSQDSDWSSSPDTSNPSVEQTDVSQAQIKQSYDRVLRLLDLYSELKNAPSDLEEKISQLKVTGAEMSESIAHLKSLSQSIEIDKGLAGKQEKASKRQTDSKHKSKRKK